MLFVFCSLLSFWVLTPVFCWTLQNMSTLLNYVCACHKTRVCNWVVVICCCKWYLYFRLLFCIQIRSHVFLFGLFYMFQAEPLKELTCGRLFSLLKDARWSINANFCVIWSDVDGCLISNSTNKVYCFPVKFEQELCMTWHLTNMITRNQLFVIYYIYQNYYLA